MDHDPDRSPDWAAILPLAEEALARFLRTWVTQDEVGREGARERLLENLVAALEGVQAPDRGEFALAFSSMGQVTMDLIESPDQQSVSEAESILRHTYMDELHKQFDDGDREWVWPPPADVEWDDLRVIVGRFMDSHVDDWPRIALAEGPMIGPHSPFQSAGQGALFFMSGWLKATSRQELADRFSLDEAHIAAWEEYLELPPKA